MAPTHDHHRFHLGGQLDRRLLHRGRRAAERVEHAHFLAALQERAHDFLDVPDRVRGLEDHAHARDELELLDLGDGVEHDGLILGVRDHADHLGMILVPDHDDLVAVGDEPGRVLLSLRDERAGRVHDLEPEFDRLVLHLRAHSVGPDDHGLIGIQAVQVGDDFQAPLPERAHDLRIVNQLAERFHARAGLVHCVVRHLDGPLHAEAEARVIRDDHFQRCSSCSARSSAIKSMIFLANARTSSRSGWPVLGGITGEPNVSRIGTCRLIERRI